jgi:hypothetical protein
MFFGSVIKPGKPVPLVPHQEGWALHLSQASLPATVPEKSRVSLLVKVQGEDPVVLCTLCAGVADTVLLVSGHSCCCQAAGKKQHLSQHHLQCCSTNLQHTPLTQEASSVAHRKVSLLRLWQPQGHPRSSPAWLPRPFTCIITSLRV